MDFCPNYRVHPAFGHTSSRLPTIHLSKNILNTAANQLRFVVVVFSFASRRLLTAAFAQGRRILASPPTLSTGVAKDFSQPFAADQPLAKHWQDRTYRPDPHHFFRRQITCVTGVEKAPGLSHTHLNPGGFARLFGFKLLQPQQATPAVLPAAVQSTTARPTSCGRC